MHGYLVGRIGYVWLVVTQVVVSKSEKYALMLLHHQIDLRTDARNTGDLDL
jgi:hypothetical protein